MILFLILATTALFFFFNYYLSNCDFYNPGVIFCAIHIAGEFACVLFGSDYNYHFHIETWLVVFIGLFAFTIINIAFLYSDNMKHQGLKKKKVELHYIKVEKIFMVSVILFQVIVFFLYFRYVIAVSRAYYGGGKSISEYIGLYRMFNIYHADQLGSLRIGRSFLVRFGKLLTAIICYPLMAIEANNFLFRKKVDALICVSIVINMMFSLVTGTRSEAFRIITAIIYYAMILSAVEKGNRLRLNYKRIGKFILFVVVLGFVFLQMKDFIGRTSTAKAKWYYSIVPYFGGPFMNLDNALQSQLPRSPVWGKYSFSEIINEFFLDIFHIKAYSVAEILTFNNFNGHNTGNVCTTYYPFMVDFGYLGVFLLICICAIYFCWTYFKDRDFYTAKAPFSSRFFFAGYMFNSLIMLIFSNRFYENFLSLYTILQVVGFGIFWKLINRWFISYEYKI